MNGSLSKQKAIELKERQTQRKQANKYINYEIRQRQNSLQELTRRFTELRPNKEALKPSYEHFKEISQALEKVIASEPSASLTDSDSIEDLEAILKDNIRRLEMKICTSCLQKNLPTSGQSKNILNLDTEKSFPTSGQSNEILNLDTEKSFPTSGQSNEILNLDTEDKGSRIPLKTNRDRLRAMRKIEQIHKSATQCVQQFVNDRKSQLDKELKKIQKQFSILGTYYASVMCDSDEEDHSQRDPDMNNLTGQTQQMSSSNVTHEMSSVNVTPETQEQNLNKTPAQRKKPKSKKNKNKQKKQKKRHHK